MTILHVTDLHLEPRWFEWLVASAPHHDLLCISGDVLDQHNPAPNSRQIERALEWLARIERPICICSGNHDLEWNPRQARWQPAHWQRRIAGPGVAIDGDVVEHAGWRIHNIACTTFPKGAPADIWLVHAPPPGLAVSRATTGIDLGDFEVDRALARHAPRVVLCGHIHEPESWFEQKDGVLFINPGSTGSGRFPNHVLFDLETFTLRRVADSAAGARCEVASWPPFARESEEGLVHA